MLTLVAFGALLLAAALGYTRLVAARDAATRQGATFTLPEQEFAAMIDFTLTAEQMEMRDLAHTFAEQEIRPVAAALDEQEEFPWELVRKAGEIGLTTFAFRALVSAAREYSVLARLTTVSAPWVFSSAVRLLAMVSPQN